MSLDSALRQRADRGTTIGADTLIERVTGELAGTPPVTRLQSSEAPLWPRRLRAGIAFAAGFLMVIGAVGAVLVLFWPSSPGPVATTVPVTTTLPATTSTTLDTTTTTSAPTSPTSTTTAVPATPDLLGITWHEAPRQGAFGADTFAGDVASSVISIDSGLLAVGGRYTSADVNLPASWTSADGITWEAGTGFDDSPGLMLDDVASGPAGLIAVSFQDSFDFDERPPVWHSEDGMSWSRIKDPGEAFAGLAKVTSVAAGSSGYVAGGTFSVGPDSGFQLGDATIWTSPDGRRWTRRDLGIGDVFETAIIRDVAITPDGIVAIGHGGDGDWFYGASPRPLGRQFVLTSPDGAAWEFAELTSEPGWPSSVDVADGTTVAVGYAGNHLAAWVAGPGESEFVEHQIVGGLNSFAGEVVIDGDRIVVVGSDFKGVGYATVWASEDRGTTWYEVTSFARSESGPFGQETYDGGTTGFRAVTRFGGGLIAVGTSGNGDAPVWIGTWNP